MFLSREEIGRSLLGSLEIALFMRKGRERFGNSYDEAMRSFIVPILLFPFSLAAIYAFPDAELSGASKQAIALMFSLRLAFGWLMFFGMIYWILSHVDHIDHFYRFVIASNWLSVPGTVIFIPVAWLLFKGAYTWDELYPFMKFLMFYTYAFTAFMAVYVLVIPWELAGFFVFIGIIVNRSTLDFIHWLGSLLSS